MPGILQYIRRLTSGGTANDRLPAFELNGRKFSDVRLAWRSSSGKVVSRAGRVSWRARMDGEPVRVIQCDNETHAAFIASIVIHPSLKAYFPACPLRHERYVVFKWVEGEQFTWQRAMREPDRLRQVAEIQAALHRFVPAVDTARVGYSYLEFLKSRFHRYRGLFPPNPAMRRILDAVESAKPKGEMRLAHPDVTGRNLVIEAGTGQVRLVDNESLTQSDCYLIDLFNTHKSFGNRLAQKLVRPYVRHYVECGGNLNVLLEHPEFFNAFWHLRLMGYYLQSGKPQKAVQVAERFGARNVELHPLVQVARQEFGERS